jgi:hypothetical protein
MKYVHTYTQYVLPIVRTFCPLYCNWYRNGVPVGGSPVSSDPFIPCRAVPFTSPCHSSPPEAFDQPSSFERAVLAACANPTGMFRFVHLANYKYQYLCVHSVLRSVVRALCACSQMCVRTCTMCLHSDVRSYVHCVLAARYTVLRICCLNLLGIFYVVM